MQYMQTIKQFFTLLKNTLYDDIVDRYLFILTLALFFLDYLIWHFAFPGRQIFILLKANLYPVKLLLVILIINTFLAIAAHNREKEVGYLLFMSSVFCSLLILILEFYYLNFSGGI